MLGLAQFPAPSAAALLGVCALALPSYGQDQRFREREVLDPQSDAWIAASQPAESGPGGPLAEARLALAQEAPRRARKVLEDYLEAYPDAPDWVEATFLLGEAWFARNRFYQAFEQYEVVLDNSAGDLFFQALRREMDVARAFLAGQPRIVWGFLRLPAQEEAIEILDRIWERAPGTALGEQSLKVKADYYYNTGDMELALDEYANLAREYPNGRYAQFAMLRAAEAAQAAWPGLPYDGRQLIEAADRYRQVQQAFPIYAEREAVDVRLAGIRQQQAAKDFAIGRWYEKVKRFEAAAFYYRQVVSEYPDTPAALDARARLRAIGDVAAVTEAGP